MILSFLTWYFLVGCGFASAKWAVEFEVTKLGSTLSVLLWPLELIFMIGLFLLILGGSFLLWITGNGFATEKPRGKLYE